MYLKKVMFTKEISQICFESTWIYTLIIQVFWSWMILVFDIWNFCGFLSKQRKQW